MHKSSVSSPRTSVRLLRSAFALSLGISALLSTGCGGNSSVGVSTGFFDFGSVAIGTHVRRMVVKISNTQKESITLAPKLSGNADFVLQPDLSCQATLPGYAACTAVIDFTPSTTDQEKASLDLGMSQNNQRIALAGTGVQLAHGQSIVSATDNPLVASYTYAPELDGDVAVEFGPDTTYGLRTSTTTTTAGAPVVTLVAGMKGNSTYHMRATVSNSGGVIATDTDQTFTTSNFSADQLPSVTVTSNGTPQPGIELANPAVGLNETYLQAYAVDLKGNLIWGYDYPDRQNDTIIQPIKHLPNGNFLAVISVNSAVTGPPHAGQLIVLRELDVAGVPVRQISLDQINSGLQALGSSIKLLDLHHDVTALPNGHWVVIGNYIKSYNGLPGTSGSTDVLGDVLVDIDQNLKPVWVWSTFDHLDVNRAPAGYPDWTHSNAVLYSPTDGNLLLSIRHQSWVIKIDYRDGAGTGGVLWKLGYQGDFQLVNGTAPQDWFYGQHQPSLLTDASAGVFQITMMDNGFTRQLSPGNKCSGSTCYTTVPIITVDESAKTASINWRETFPPEKFAVWGGGTTRLANGNLEYDLCAEPNNTSEVGEITTDGSDTMVWTMKTAQQNLYRANRIPSLYAGVQW